MDVFGGGGVEQVVFEDDEVVFCVFQADGAREARVGEGVDYVVLGGGGVFALEGVDFEAEGRLLVVGPEVLGAVVDVLVEGWVVCSGAP